MKLRGPHFTVTFQVTGLAASRDDIAGGRDIGAFPLPIPRMTRKLSVEQAGAV